MASEISEATDFEKMSEALDSMGDTSVQILMDFMNEVCTRLDCIEREQNRQTEAIKRVSPSIGVSGSHPDYISTDDLYKERHNTDMYQQIMDKMAKYESAPKLILHTGT